MDFTTAFGRLLHDGRLRDAFAVAPARVVEELSVRQSDRPALLELPARDLEIQAEVLLRKRFDLVKKIIPQIASNLGENAWSCFLEYSRCHWPQDPNRQYADAMAFCQHCAAKYKTSIFAPELKRLKFVLGEKTFAIHFVRGIPIRNRQRNGFQILFRKNSKHWRELLISFGL